MNTITLWGVQSLLFLFALMDGLMKFASSTAITQKRELKHVKRHSANQNADLITEALDNLTANYDNRVRPGFDEGIPTRVRSYYLVTGIGPASEQDMEYTLDIIFRQRWRDERLAFAESKRMKGITELRLNSKMVESVWTPDTFFRNGKKSIAHKITVPNRLLRLKPTGEILYTMRLTIKAKCPMILIDFPMDVHTCHLVYGSYAYTKDDVQYDWYTCNGTVPVKLSNAPSRLNQFNLINYTWSRNIINTTSGEFVVLETKFHLKRQMGYYIIQTYLPCILIVILSQNGTFGGNVSCFQQAEMGGIACCSSNRKISFWINKEAVPARTVSGIMTVLNLTTLSISTRQSLPKVAYATALDWYMAVSFAFCFAALIEFASVNYHQIKIKKLPAKKHPESVTDLEPNLIQCCSSIQDRFIELTLSGGKVCMVSLKDLVTIASGTPLNRFKGFRYWFRRIYSVLLWQCDSEENHRVGDKGFSTHEKKMAMNLLTTAEKEIIDVATSQGGVSKIDQIARLVFPLAFFFFNGMYWFIYLSHQSHEVSYRMDSNRVTPRDGLEC